MNRNVLYRSLLAVAAGFVLWTLANRFFVDPQAAEFLRHKTRLNHALNLSAWLTVLDIHIGFACAAMLSGALNFSSWMRRSSRRAWHRTNGYVYVASVAAVVGTSGYMAPYATGGRAVSMAFNLLNLIWIAATLAAIVQIRRKRVDNHRRWMVRSYAFCFTNLVIRVLTSAFTGLLGLRYETGYALSVMAAIVLLALAAELVNRLLWRNSAP